MKKALFIFALVISLFSCRRIISTGFFRNVKPHFEGTIFKTIPLAGAEDITISYSDEFALLSSTDRVAIRNGEIPSSGLFFMDLKTDNPTLINLTENSEKYNDSVAFFGVSIFKVAPKKYRVAAINNSKEKPLSIEFFWLEGETLTHDKSLTHPLLKFPNDIVLIDENRFYFTNDHGKTKKFARTIEDYAGLKRCNIVYYDGVKFTEVANRISFANGINIDFERKLLFVTSTRASLLKVYTIEPNGTLSFIENIKCKTGADNIEIDPEGNLWIAGHPKLLRYQAYAFDKKEKAPSEIIKLTYRGKKDYTIESIYIGDGSKISASSVAAPYKNKIIVGSVMDKNILILERNK